MAGVGTELLFELAKENITYFKISGNRINKKEMIIYKLEKFKTLDSTFKALDRRMVSISEILA